MRDLWSAFPVEPGHELAVNLAGGFEFLAAPGECFLRVEECLLEFGHSGACCRAGGLSDLREHFFARQLAEQHAGTTSPLFATQAGTALSRDAVEHLVTRHAATAAQACPTLQAKKITPHTLRHTAAMNLLHAGVDITVIALWMGHESPATTRIYLHADMALKEKAIARTTPPGTPAGRYQPPDELLAFLNQL